MEIELSGKHLSVHPASSSDAPLVVINTYGDEGDRVLEAVKRLTNADFTLLSVSGLEWNRDMSPWESPALFRGEPPFAGGADDYLQLLTGVLIPAAAEEAEISPAYTAIAGYSMAGLFALYSLYRTESFSRAASASGSLWFLGLMDFVRDNEPMVLPDKLYLSLGDKESRTRNQTMSAVERNTSFISESFKKRGVETVFEMNPGNHFTDPEARMAKAIAWLLMRCTCSVSSSPTQA